MTGQKGNATGMLNRDEGRKYKSLFLRNGHKHPDCARTMFGREWQLLQYPDVIDGVFLSGRGGHIFRNIARTSQNTYNMAVLGLADMDLRGMAII